MADEKAMQQVCPELTWAQAKEEWGTLQEHARNSLRKLAATKSECLIGKALMRPPSSKTARRVQGACAQFSAATQTSWEALIQEDIVALATEALAKLAD